jgi:hypothetical protein
MHGNERTGLFRPPSPQRTAQQRTTLTLIATTALAISTVIAMTVVSIGIARAEALGAAFL